MFRQLSYLTVVVALSASALLSHAAESSRAKFGTPATAPGIKSTRWVGQGQWNSSTNGQGQTGRFMMDLLVGDVGENEYAPVTGAVSTPQGNYYLTDGLWTPDAQRLELFYEPNSSYPRGTLFYIRGHISESRLFTAESFALVPSTRERAEASVLTQALRFDLHISGENYADRLVQPLGGITAFAQ